MNIDISERSFEETIEAGLLAGGPDDPAGRTVRGGDAPPYGAYAPGGYHRRRPEDYDRARCLLPQDALDFVLATQPREWAKLGQYHRAEARERFLARLAHEVERRGTLDVLRKGIKESGCKFALAYFPPASGLNPESQRLHACNLFAVVRQLHYSEKNENSLDLVLFCNGLPLVTAELKNPLTGQTVEHAMAQYRRDRDPREPLLAFRRCLAHFAVDPDLVYMTTHLHKEGTRFLPFNRGKFGGAGNPPSRPAEGGYATDYLWRQVFARDSMLNLLQYFMHEFEEEDDEGRRTGERRLIFPRYHQLDCVRRLVADARAHGPGQCYLVQHSAGSGKSNSIAWLAHQLSVLHDAQDRRVFDSIVIITDRRVLDRQLQRTVRQFEQVEGVVENIDTTSRQLKEALEAGKTIIVSTLQKFPVIAGQMGDLPGRRFAVIVDEAHSSQSGESTKSLKAVLRAATLEQAAAEEEGDEPEDMEDRIVAEIRRRGRQSHLSYFAFTATPKPKTLELFGTPDAAGKFQPFSLYSMRQAIDEGFILDVLANYTTYTAYWRLLKTVQDDPRYEKHKADRLLRAFVDLHQHAIGKKVEIMVEHFHDQVAGRIGGQARAMVVTRSRKHAVHYKRAIDAYLRRRGYPYLALVAFSGTVQDEGAAWTEAGMNHLPEEQTARTFASGDYRFLIVAEKFQTGFDQPLLHTMYVDKRLAGLHAVQTLSRLNRTHPAKRETMVLDFVNEADDIRKAFAPYYEKTILSEATDPNLLYDIETRLLDAGVFGQQDVDTLAAIYFGKRPTQDRLYAALAPSRERFLALDKDDKTRFRGQLNDYVRLYAFLSQVLPFADVDLEKLYVFARLLARYLPYEPEQLPLEIQQNIDMESYRVQRTSEGKIDLPRGQGELQPDQGSSDYVVPPEEMEALSQIIRELNERFGADLAPGDRVTIQQLEQRLADDPSLGTAVRANTPENARLAFDQFVTDRLQDIVDSNFSLYRRVTDDEAFGRALLDFLFERFRKRLEKRER